MNRLDIFRAIKRHQKLAANRHPAMEQAKWAKAFGYIGMAFIVMYLMFISIMLAMIANSSGSVTSYELMYGLLPFILALDFFVRFTVQQTPSQQIKSYVLLPLSKYVCVDSFLFLTFISPTRFIWFALFLPYAIMSVVFSYGFMAMVGFLLGFFLLLVFNSYWYMLVRALINTRLYWWALPAAFYALAFLPWLLAKDFNIEKLFYFYGDWGRAFTHFNPLAYLAAVAVIVLMVFINRKVQYNLSYKELSKTEDTKLRHVTKLESLNRFGDTGEYLKLEIKSIMRNKNIRKSFISAIITVVIFSLLVSFTNIYDNRVMTLFWCMYNYSIFGNVFVNKVMCYEGNYIDCLMVHRENIISLLRAKYYFYTLMLLLPLVLMFPMIYTGKFSLLGLLSLLVFTGGFTYFMLFQLAIYNKVTMPLNEKFIGKGGMENNYFQIILSLASFTLPIAIVALFDTFFSETTSFLMVMFIGLAFMGLHPLWLRNIYKRMMKRKYVNLASFHSSR